MITLTLTNEQAAYLFDEVGYMTIERGVVGLSRYERAMSRTSCEIRQMLADQGVEGVMARA